MTIAFCEIVSKIKKKLASIYTLVETIAHIYNSVHNRQNYFGAYESNHILSFGCWKNKAHLLIWYFLVIQTPLNWAQRFGSLLSDF